MILVELGRVDGFDQGEAQSESDDGRVISTHSGRPADEARLAEYETGPYKGFGDQVQQAFAAIVPDDADVGGVADAIVEIVDTPFGERPFRVHFDPTQDGADVGFTVLDRLREMRPLHGAASVVQVPVPARRPA